MLDACACLMIGACVIARMRFVRSFVRSVRERKVSGRKLKNAHLCGPLSRFAFVSRGWFQFTISVSVHSKAQHRLNACWRMRIASTNIKIKEKNEINKSRKISIYTHGSTDFGSVLFLIVYFSDGLWSNQKIPKLKLNKMRQLI